jgi:hypothetical protein
MAFETRVQGRKSKVQWNGKVLLGGDYKLNTWPIDEDPKKNGTNQGKTYRGNQVVWILKNGIINQHLLTIVCA